MTNDEADRLWRLYTSLCDQRFRLRCAIEHLQRETTGYFSTVDEIQKNISDIEDRAWDAYDHPSSSQFVREVLSYILYDCHIGTDDC